MLLQKILYGALPVEDAFYLFWLCCVWTLIGIGMFKLNRFCRSLPPLAEEEQSEWF